MKITNGILIVALLLYPAVGMANEPDGVAEVNIELGGAAPSGGHQFSVPDDPGHEEVDGNWKSSPYFGIAALLRAAPWLRLGLALGITNYSLDSNDPNAAAVDAHRKVIQVSPEVEVGRWLSSSSLTWKPYLNAGVGLYHITDSVGNTIAPDNCDCDENGENCSACDSTASATTSSDHTGFNIGGGAMFQASEHLAWGPNVEYHSLLDGGSFHYVTASVRLSLLF